MVVKKVAAVAPGFEGGEPLTLANSRGLKSALKFFVKIGLFLEFRRIPGKLGDGGGADAKRYVLLFALFCLFFLEALTLAVASKAWRGLTSLIGQQAALILLGAALLGARRCSSRRRCRYGASASGATDLARTEITVYIEDTTRTPASDTTFPGHAVDDEKHLVLDTDNGKL